MCPTSYTKISSSYLFCLFKMYPLTGPCHIKWSERILFYSTSQHHREDNGSLSGRGGTGTHGEFSDPLVHRKSTERVACIFVFFLAEVAASPWLLCFCVISAASPLKRELTQLLCIDTSASFSHGPIWLLNDSSKSSWSILWLTKLIHVLPFPAIRFYKGGFKKNDNFFL